MFTMRRALRENNGATAVCMAAISSALLLLGRVVTAKLSLEAKLLALSLVWVVMYVLQRVLVGKRRSSGRWFIQYTAMAAYYLPAPLAFYAASVLSSTSNINESTPLLVIEVLVMFWFTIALSTRVGVLFTNMTAYSLRNRQRDRHIFLKWLVFLAYVEWEWARISSSNWQGLILAAHVMVVHFFGAFITLFANPSESTLDCQTKKFADYMKREFSKSASTSTSTSSFFDDDDATPNSNSSLQLNCCRYPFVQGKDGQWITVKDLFHQCGDLPTWDKDICLSYSLSRLLARRYYGFHCAEEGDDKVRRFGLAGLGTTDGGYKRAFTIVEVQLAFLHDYFFTACLPIIESGLGDIKVAPQLMLAFSGAMLSFVFPIPESYGLLRIQTFVLVQVTLFMLWCVIVGLPVQDVLATYWHPIHTAFRKLNSLPVVFDPFQTQTGGAYWRNKIDQYSILQDYNRRRSPKKAILAWFQENMLSQPSYEFIKHLTVEEKEVDMLELDSMRELVANTLRDIYGPPTNGTRSLKINKEEINRDRKNRDGADYDWLWTCRQETHTDTILIWHIATCYCDMSLHHSDQSKKFPQLDEADTCHYKVAMALSRYCAYLVAFLPEFLPENSLITKQVFQDVIQDAQGELGMTPMEDNQKYTKMRNLQHEQQKTLHKGVELGRQLEMIDEHKVRWKVIADFWEETILYVAPSDNAEAHIEQLAKGGEFITHLWAMLSNAGILKRATGEWHPPPASTTTEGPLTQTKITNVQTQGSIVPSNDEAPAPSMFSPTTSHHSQSSKPTAEEKGKQPQIPEDQ